MKFKSTTIVFVAVACLAAAAPQGEDPVVEDAMAAEDTISAEDAMAAVDAMAAEDAVTTEHHFGGDLDALLEHYDQIDVRERRRRATDAVEEKKCTKDGVKGRCTAYYLCSDSSDSSAGGFGLIDSRLIIAEDKEACPGYVDVCCLSLNKVNN